MNVTEVPAQILFWLTLIVTLAAIAELTIIVIDSEFAGLPVTQLAFEVITT